VNGTIDGRMMDGTFRNTQHTVRASLTESKRATVLGPAVGQGGDGDFRLSFASLDDMVLCTAG
jgi:hypothetical protein